MSKKIIVSMLLASFMVSPIASADESVKTDRYTLVNVDPKGDQKEPLTTVVSMSFGADIRTVGEAITELLNGSGYRWQSHEEDETLNSLPLPSVIRSLGPIRLHEALSTVAGQAWSLKVDELHRTVWFEVRKSAVSTLN